MCTAPCRILDAVAALPNDGEETTVTVLDINDSMVEEGKRRAQKRWWPASRLEWVVGNAKVRGMPWSDDVGSGMTVRMTET